MTPSDCWIRQSFSRPHDSLTYAAELLTLTGLELHTAAECCNVQTDDGNPYECVCVPACVPACLEKGRARACVPHNICSECSSPPLSALWREKKQQFAANEASRSEPSEHVGAGKTKSCKAKRQNLSAFQKESDCNRKSLCYQGIKQRSRCLHKCCVTETRV